MAYNDRLAAWQTLLAARRANQAATTLGITDMLTVAANTITSQQITDLNAALAAANVVNVAIDTANATLTAKD